MADVGGISAGRLRSFMERVERLREEKRALDDDLKEVFAEAKGEGWDTKAMKVVLKERASDKDALDEHNAIVDTYRAALGMIPATHAQVAHEAAE